MNQLCEKHVPDNSYDTVRLKKIHTIHDPVCIVPCVLRIYFQIKEYKEVFIEGVKTSAWTNTSKICVKHFMVIILGK